MSEPGEHCDPIGFRNPPKATRFVKGRSGNPRGQPRSRHREIPYDTVLEQMVTIREDGLERRVTAAEAYILQLTRKGLQGDNAAARASLAAIETARASRPSVNDQDILRVVFVTYGVGTVLKQLGIGIKRNPLSKERVRWELCPWIVQAALDRLGGRVPAHDQQREVWRITHKRHQVHWPEWWTEKG